MKNSDYWFQYINIDLKHIDKIIGLILKFSYQIKILEHLPPICLYYIYICMCHSLEGMHIV